MPGAYLEWLSYFSDDTRQALLREVDDWGLDDFRAIWAESEGAHPLDRILNVNHRTYLLDDLLPKVDRMAMAHSLEVRSPFLDAELADLALRLPPSYKLGRLQLKRVLKASVADLLPEHILKRRKRGFGVPLDRWFRTDLKGYTEAMLGAPEARVRAHLNGEVLDRLLAEHDAGARNHGHGIWALLTLEVFLRREGW
jgi:asparagine synthase (glutamine-hydrolysing)